MNKDFMEIYQAEVRSNCALLGVALRGLVEAVGANAARDLAPHVLMNLTRASVDGAHKQIEHALALEAEQKALAQFEEEERAMAERAAFLQEQDAMGLGVAPW